MKIGQMNSKIIKTSTKKFETGIFLLQVRHLPFRKMKLNTGNSSYHFSGLIQLSHWLLLNRKDELSADVSAYINEAQTPPNIINIVI